MLYYEFLHYTQDELLPYADPADPAPTLMVFVLENTPDIGINSVDDLPNKAYELGIEHNVVLFSNSTWHDKSPEYQAEMFGLLATLQDRIFIASNVALFEPNESPAWELTTNSINEAIELVKETSNITAYLTICNEETNTPERIENNELAATISIETADHEFIYMLIRVYGETEELDEETDE